MIIIRIRQEPLKLRHEVLILKQDKVEGISHLKKFMDIHPLSLKDQRIQRIIRIQTLIKYPLIHLQFLFNLSPHYIHNLTKMNHLLLMIKTYPQFDLISLTPSIENNRLTIFAFIFFIVTFYLTELYVIFYLVCFCYFYGLFFYLAGVVFLLIEGYFCIEDVLALGV